MENSLYGDTRIDMFMAGDSSKGKAIAAKLADDAGFAHCESNYPGNTGWGY